jgi:hypothetical protein
LLKGEEELRIGRKARGGAAAEEEEDRNVEVRGRTWSLQVRANMAYVR